MDTLTRDELLNIIIALDNEAASNDNVKEAQMFRSLKWKVFALYTEREEKIAPPQCPYCGDDTCAGHCA